MRSIDIGTSKACALVAEIGENHAMAVLGLGVVPCSGLRKGVVVNIDATVTRFKARQRGREDLGAKVASGIVGIAGSHIRGFNSHGIVAVRGGEMGPRDVDR